MGTTAYQSSGAKRLFLNYPFKQGMVDEELTSSEGRCKRLINLDYSNAGDRAYPRSSFVNAVLYNGFGPTRLPEATIVQTTNIGPKFLISTKTWVSEDDFVNDVVNEYPYESVTGTFDLFVTKLLNEVTDYNSTRGAVVAYMTNVIDGDTITVTIDGVSQNVRLLGINTPETGEDGYDEAKALLESIFSTYGPQVTLLYDPNTEYKDAYGRLLAYVFNNQHFVNGILARSGYVKELYIDDDFMLYEEINNLYYVGINAGYGLYGSTADLTLSEIVAFVDNEMLESGIDLTAVDPESTLYMKNTVEENQTIVAEFYDSIAFASENDLTATDLFEVSEGNTYIQILRNDYTKTEYEHTVEYFEYPHLNHAWRNAISFLGRVIVDGAVAYKGLITLQYDGTDHKIIVLKPETPEPLSWTIDDTSSIYFNALSSNPYLYEEHILDETASYFMYPTLSTALFYDKDPSNADAKVFSSFKALQNCFLKVYPVFPKMPYTNFYGCYTKFKFSPNTEEDVYHKIAYIPKDNYPIIFAYDGYVQWAVIEDALELEQIPEEGYNVLIMNNAFVGADGVWKVTTDGQAQPTYTHTKLTDEEGMMCTVTSSSAKYFRFEDTWVLLDENNIFEYDTDETIIIDYDFYNRYNISNPIKNLSNLNGNTLEIEIQTNYIDEDSIAIENTMSDPEITSVTVDKTYIGNLGSSATEVEYQVYTSAYWNEAAEAVINCTIKNTETGAHSLFVLSDTGSVAQYLTFEGFTFKFIWNGDYIRHTDTITINFTSNSYSYTTTSRIIYLNGEKFIDPHDMLSTHNVYNATHLAQWDRYVILYGPSMGSNSLQFLEYNNFSLAPFPSGQIIFDNEIKHVHVHKESIYVFCTNGIYILHDGLTYSEVTMTFAYSGISLHEAEKGTVASIGNNVVVFHNSRGYMIRTNVYVDDASDVYVVPFTSSVDSLIESPRLYFKERMQYGYGILIEDLENIKATYKVHIDNNEVYLVTSYYVADPNQKLLTTYIYNNESGKWKMYDSLAATYPIEIISSSNSKGFDYLCVNNINDGIPTLATYLYSLPDNEISTNELGDAIAYVFNTSNQEWVVASEENGVQNPVHPISCFFDTGSLDVNSMHKKKVRDFLLSFSDVPEQSIEFLVTPYADGIAIDDPVTLEAIIDAYGNIQTAIDLSTEVIVPQYFTLISPALGTIDGFSIPESAFTVNQKLILSTKMNMACKLMGFKVNLYVTSRLKITHYGIVYRQMSARR